MLSFVFICCTTPCHSLSLIVTCYQLLSFVVTRRHSLSFVCHSIYHSLSFVVIRYHSLYQSLLFYNKECLLNKLIRGLKKRLLDNKSWEPLDTTVRCMHEWLCGWNICTTVELVSWRMKNKTEDYINTCNGRPFHEEKKYFMAPFYGWGSTVSRLQSYYEEIQEFLLLTWSTS